MSKISLVIVLTVCHTILMMLVLTNLVPVCLSAGTCLYSLVERSTLRVTHLTQEPNTMTLK